MESANPGAPPALDRDLFAVNSLPLSHYVDADAARLDGYTSVRLPRYGQWVPRAFRAGQALFASLSNRNRWAEQRHGKGGKAVWVTHTRGAAGTRGGVAYPQKGLQLTDVLKAMTRRDRYAVACFDGYVETTELPYAACQPYAWPTDVSVLLLDVDMDDAWRQQDLAAVRRQVAVEKAVLSLLGFSCSWLKTGGRGHQLVVPLPCPAPRSAASFLALAIKRLLSELSGKCATVDACNLDHVMRLAGGRHSRTHDLALFFDPESCRLYEPQDQLDFLARAYRPNCPPSGGWLVAEFATAMDEIAEASEYLLGVRPALAIQSSPQSLAWALPTLADRLDANPVIRRLSDAFLHFVGASLVEMGREPESSHDDTLTDGESEQTPPLGTITSEQVVRRAMDIWECGFLQGGSWEWLTRGDGGGGNGIWAAYCLFGEAARDRLMEKSREVGARSDHDLAERERTIHRLCDSHERRVRDGIALPAEPPRRPSGTASPTEPLSPPASDAQGDLADTLVKEIIAARAGRESGRKATLQPRTLAALRKIIIVLLRLLADSERVEISRRSLHAAILQAFGADDSAPTFKTVDNLLELVVAGKSECLVPIFCECRPVVKARSMGKIVRDETPRNIATAFRRGPRLLTDITYL
jgi:hypothetical protein